MDVEDPFRNSLMHNPRKRGLLLHLPIIELIMIYFFDAQFVWFSALRVLRWTVQLS